MQSEFSILLKTVSSFLFCYEECIGWSFWYTWRDHTGFWYIQFEVRRHMLQREYVKIKPNPKRRWFATTIFKCSGSIAQCNVLVSFHSRRTSDRDKKNKRPKVLWIIWCPDKLNCIYVRWSVVILSKPSFILYPTIQQKPNTEQMLCCLDLKQRVQHF